MRVPDSLWSLVDAGVVGEVLRPLLSGKEAEVFLVSSGGQQRVAKVYKEAHLRSFKHRADYTEGRVGRNSRDRRAIAKRSRHGRAQDEAAWRSAEVEAIYKLRAAGVRVPEPVNYMDGVLVMELVVDAAGNPAPRLGDLELSTTEAVEIFDHLLQEVVRMLCAGVVHADLSDFNILMSADGPVIIDFPQVVDPASNGAARRLLMRDVDNLQDFLHRFVPGRRRPYAQEMWALYERNQLTPETRLTGEHRASRRKADTKDVLGLIGDAKRDQQRRRGAQPTGRGRGRGQGRAPSEPRTEAEPPKTGARGRWVEVKIEPPPDRSKRSRRGSRGANGTPARDSGRKPNGTPQDSGRKPNGAPARDSGRKTDGAARGSGRGAASNDAARGRPNGERDRSDASSGEREGHGGGTRRRRRRRSRSKNKKTGGDTSPRGPQ